MDAWKWFSFRDPFAVLQKQKNPFPIIFALFKRLATADSFVAGSTIFCAEECNILSVIDLCMMQMQVLEPDWNEGE